MRAISMAQLTIVCAHSCVAACRDDSPRRCTRNKRLRAVNGGLAQDIALLREEMRIKDARMGRIEPHRRPHFCPTDRMAILELKAARASLRQAADAFQISPLTVASWSQRLDEEGPAALVQTPQPVNRSPDFVAYLVQRLKVLCPQVGKVEIAEIPARSDCTWRRARWGECLKRSRRPSRRRRRHLPRAA
jgi:Helix-turn-helix domain